MLITILILLVAVIVINGAVNSFANAGRTVNDQGGMFLAGIAGLAVYGGLFYFAFML